MTGTWGAAWTLARFAPRRYVPGGLGWAAAHALPFVAGLALKAIFDRVSSGPAEAASALVLVAVFVAVEAVRSLVLYVNFAIWPGWWNAVATLMRLNLLSSLLRDREPPATRLPGSSSEAVARFREDVVDVVWFVDVWVDVAGGVVFTAAALAVMARIDAAVTAVVALPMVAVMVATRLLGRHIRRWHEGTREAGARVSSLVGDLFGNVLALKAGGAEPGVLARLRTENRARGQQAVRAEVSTNLLPVSSEVAVDLAIGLVLLLAAPAARAGDFTVGDLALFTTYAAGLTGLPRWTGRMLARHREAGVALTRMARLLPDGDVAGVVAHRPVHLHRPPPTPSPPPVLRDGDRLRRFEVRDLTALHPASLRGVSQVDLVLPAGSFTVVTGAIGAGKTTLLRALLGLVPVQEGALRWNGRLVERPSADLAPPLVAYVPQVPRLFSDTLSENVLLGWPAGDRELGEALALAALDDDVDDLPAGLATQVGPHGVRLSGGQVQRASTARALVRRPELLLVDDVSSALDVETEQRLWRGLAATGITALVVSHRRAALEQADRVVVLDRGRVCAAGPLADLLRTSAEMRRLWREELLVEGEESIGARTRARARPMRARVQR